VENNDSSAGPAVKAKKRSGSRGATQSRVPGEANARPHANGRAQSVQPSRKVFGTGKCRKAGKRHTDPRDAIAAAAKRVKSHPNHTLCIRSNRFFCQCCGTELSSKSSSCRSHVKSDRHKKLLKAYNKKIFDDNTIDESLDAFDAEHDPEGQSLAKELRVERTALLRTLWQAGINLNKLECTPFRVLLTRSMKNGTVPSRSQMSAYIPVVRLAELRALVLELGGKYFVVIWDGTTRVAEVYVVVVRFWAKGKVQQRVIGLRLLDHPLTGPENCGVLMSVAAQVDLQWDHCLMFMSDRAKTNDVAVEMMKPQAPVAMIGDCFPHTICHVGDENELNILDGLVKALTGTQKSTNVKVCFRLHFQETMIMNQAVRWYVAYIRARQADFSELPVFGPLGDRV